METGGVGEPETTRGISASQWYLEAEEAVGDPLDDLPEEALLALIGAYSLTPIESRNAALAKYAEDDLTALLREKGFDLDTSVNLVRRGKETVERVLGDWRDDLREKICPLKTRKGVRRADLLALVSSALAALLSVGAGVVALIAYYLVKFSLDELCDGWPQPLPIAVS
jgi:hypothetical protein